MEEGIDPDKGRAVINLSFQNLKVGISGIWLLLLYFMCATFVIYSLSAHQLNHAIRSYPVDGKPLTLWEVRSLYGRWTAASEGFTTALADFGTYSEEKSASEFELNYEITVLSDLEGRHQKLESQLVTIVRETGADVAGIEATVEAMKTARFSLGALDSGLVDLQGQLRDNQQFIELSKEYLVQSDRLHEIGAKVKFFEREIKRLTDLIATAKNDMENNAKIQKASLSLDGSTEDPRVGDFLDAMQFLQPKVAPNYVPSFVWMIVRPSFLGTIPADMLTLILVLAMGVLGGTIHLTQIFLTNAKRSDDAQADYGAWYFLFRPMLGSITALSVYILVKSGALLISVGETGSQGAQLSPFFVSFLGVISGMLAEQAVVTIQDTGRRWFSSANVVGRDRWAIALKDKLAAAGQGADATREKIANLLGVPPADIIAWEVEEKPVPFRFQTTLAAYFQALPREFFTDQK